MTTLAIPAPPLVGVLELASKYRYGLTSRGIPLYLFRPYDTDQPEYIVGSSERDLSRNQIAVVEVPTTATTTAPAHGHPRANLLRLLGPVGDPAAERTALLQHYCPLNSRLETAAVTEAATAAVSPDTTDDANRFEISAATGWTVLHVDPAGCRDIDDAIAYHPATNRWATIIADVAAVIPVVGPLNARARAIGATFYDLEGRVVTPMLPPTLSEDAASLLPGQRRRGIALISNPPCALQWAFCWVTVEHSFSYESFSVSPLAARLGLPPGFDSHEWIADRMFIYNAAAGALLKEASQGLLRVQPPADAAAVATWPADLQHLANERATYAVADRATEQNHTGLGLPAYAHASSPLRRFADLVNQRVLKILIAGDRAGPATPPEIAEHLNRRADANRRWSRDLTFLTHVTPGKVHEIEVVPLSTTQVWVPLWSRLLRLRHEVPEDAPLPTRIAIFCDPTRRNWRSRILTAPATGSSGEAPAPAAATE
jgi:hypothetical protein